MHMNGFDSLNVPTCCAFCLQPFRLDKNKTHYKAFRGEDGRLYCSPDCEEAQYKFGGGNA